MTILHIGSTGSIMNGFVNFLNENFEPQKHTFLLSPSPNHTLPNASNTYSLKTGWRRIFNAISITSRLQRSEKVILHGLFNPRLVLLLALQPWVLKKCYWVIWGADLYTYQLGKRDWKWYIKELFRRPIIKRMGNLITYIEGDVDLARDWYGATGQYHECIMYPSNLYKEIQIKPKKDSTIHFLVGNSADPSNNHMEALGKLLPFKDLDIRIHIPLSYGNKEYAATVCRQASLWFGEKAKPITELMPFDKYMEFLSSIDIAIFNHRRQQAMGNTITLLGLGKKVYIRNDTTQWQFFKEKNITVFDIESEINLKSNTTINSTPTIILYFSKKNLITQWNRIYE